MRLPITLLVLAYASTAAAQVPIAGIGYRVVPQAAAPASFTPGACAGGGPCVGLWVPSGGTNANLPLYRLNSGSDNTFSLPGGYVFGTAGPQTLTLDATRLGVYMNINGTLAGWTGGLAPPGIPTAILPIPTNQVSFQIYDSTITDSLGNPYVGFGVTGGKGAIFGHSIYGGGEQINLLGDVDTWILSQSNLAEGGELALFGGFGGSLAGAFGGRFKAYGGQAGPNAAAHSDGGMVLDSGRDVNGNSAAPGQLPGYAATSGDISIAQNYAKIMNVGRKTGIPFEINIFGNANSAILLNAAANDSITLSTDSGASFTTDDGSGGKISVWTNTNSGNVTIPDFGNAFQVATWRWNGNNGVDWFKGPGNTNRLFGIDFNGITSIFGFTKNIAPAAAVPADPRTYVGGGGGAPAFQNSWVNYNVAFEPAAFWKDVDGTIHMLGMVANGTVDTAVFTLPAGFRPSKTLMLSVWAFNGSCNLRILNTGDVGTIGCAGGPTFLSFDGVVFLAEQ